MGEGHITWDGHRTWYRVAGDIETAGVAPLVVVHGGPGAPSYYLSSLAELAGTGRPVVLYDQLGCGRSDRVNDAPSDFWTIELFHRELTVLLDGLGIADGYHVYGQSWGGMLALEHALTHPPGLKSMVLANTLASTAVWVSEAKRLVADLPQDVQDTLERHESAGTTDSDEYTEAMLVFYGRHLCRIDPFPDDLMQTFMSLMEDPRVYNSMWGPSEFTCTGSLGTWDVTARLGEIDVPTLILSGRHDEATPVVVEPLHAGITGSEWVVLENSSHSSHVEEKDLTHRLVAEFLARVEASGSAAAGP
jgi:L-proline amide hydrolase